MSNSNTDRKFIFTFTFLVIAIVTQTGTAFWHISGLSERTSQLERRAEVVRAKTDLHQEKLGITAVGLAKLDAKMDTLLIVLSPGTHD